MKKETLSTFYVIILSITLFGQDKTFEYQGFSIGSSLAGQSYYPRAMMPEVINTGSEYIMYFGYESPTENYIMYATSIDMNTWQVGDTVLIGSNDTTNREFIIGGPRVIKLPSGQYRMFYRCSQKYSNAPYYHIRSAISNDGKNFTKEGVCIEIKNYNPTSFFKHVGHSEFYYDSGNNLRALLTAKDTTMTTSQPDNIYSAQSLDGGLTWSNFVSKYQSCHDPVVIKDSLQNYHAYFTYLNTSFKTVNSTNGVAWPSTADYLFMIQDGDTITESSSPTKIADLGAAVNTNGNIVIFSNHSTAPGPWTHIAFWTESNTSGIILNEFQEPIKISPNPFNSILRIEGKWIQNSDYEIIDNLGQVVIKDTFNSTDENIDLKNLNRGQYILKFEGKKFKILKD
jgi:hypothetical protein